MSKYVQVLVLVVSKAPVGMERQSYPGRWPTNYDVQGSWNQKSSVIVLLVLLFLTGPLAFMPEAVLSAVVFHIGVDLIDVAGMRKIYQQRRSEFWVALLTLLMVVFVGVEQGIILAVVLSLIDHIRRGYRPKNALLVPTESDTQLRATSTILLQNLYDPCSLF